MCRNIICIISLVAVFVFVPGCNPSGDSENSGDPNETFASEMDYPEEPHGFVSSVVSSGGEYVWVGGGDVIPNICLPNQDDEVLCLGEYWESEETEILFVDFSAEWCLYCNLAANDEPTILQQLTDLGWNAEWITILYEDANFSAPVVSDAAAWKIDHSSTGDVLYDNAWTWRNEPWQDKRPDEDRDGQPLIFIVDTSTMQIWYAFPGYSPDWATPEGAGWLADSFETISEQSEQ